MKFLFNLPGFRAIRKYITRFMEARAKQKAIDLVTAPCPDCKRRINCELQSGICPHLYLDPLDDPEII